MTMRRHDALAVLACAVTLAVATTAAAQNDPALAARIERIISRPEFVHAMWGIEFYDADAMRPIYALNEQKLFTPGSTTKLLTAGTALQMLGAAHRFHTKVYRTGPLTADGTLNGDLVLVASGDPNLSQRLQPDGTLAFENHDHAYGGAPDTKAVPGDPLMIIKRLVAQVKAKGVKRITGRVRVDATLFHEGTRELGSGVVVSPISVNDNVVDVSVTAGATPDAPVAVTVSPPNSYVRFVNKLTTGAGDSRPRVAIEDAIPAADSTVTVTVSGSVPALSTPVLYAYPVESPSRFAEVVLADALRAEGIAISPTSSELTRNFASLVASYIDANVVAEHVSAPATEMVKVILKVSQNMHASSMPLLMGALFGKARQQNGFDVEREWLVQEGLDPRSAQQADGAGGDAHFTPAFMVSYLRMMSRRADFGAFKAALPVLGRDGTLYQIQPKSPAAGHVFAKTGTYAVDDPLNQGLFVTAKGLAGYMTTSSGKQLIVVVYVNNVLVSTAPDEVTRVVGQALGEVAAAAWEYR